VFWSTGIQLSWNSSKFQLIDDHVHGLRKQPLSEDTVDFRLPPEPRDQIWPLARCGPGTRPDLPRKGPVHGHWAPIKYRSLAPATTTLAVPDQPKFQACLSANSAAACGTESCLPGRGQARLAVVACSYLPATRVARFIPTLTLRFCRLLSVQRIDV
jgi:hypothetical protein